MKKISKVASAGLMAAAMLTTSTVAFIAPMSASAGQCLGETDFTKKGLPWHTCETNPAPALHPVWVFALSAPSHPAEKGRWKTLLPSLSGRQGLQCFPAVLL